MQGFVILLAGFLVSLLKIVGMDLNQVLPLAFV